MRIAYIGNFSQAHCTESTLSATARIWARSFETPRERASPGQLASKVKGYDLVLWTRTWPGLSVTKT